MTIEALLPQLLGPVGLAVGLIFALLGLYLGWWVPGPWLRREERRANRAEVHAERLTAALLKTAGVADALIEATRRPSDDPARHEW